MTLALIIIVIKDITTEVRMVLSIYNIYSYVDKYVCVCV